MLGNPFGDCTLQNCPSMPFLEVLKGFPAQVRDVGLLSLPDAVFFDVNRLSKVPAYPSLDPIITRDRWRLSLAFLARQSSAFRGSNLGWFSLLFFMTYSRLVTGNSSGLFRGRFPCHFLR
jgi:hypothetical protein